MRTGATTAVIPNLIGNPEVCGSGCIGCTGFPACAGNDGEEARGMTKGVRRTAMAEGNDGESAGNDERDEGNYTEG